MPNGGSDCCGTCWFNSTHEGKVGIFRATVDRPVRCVIRDLAIENAFWTYCANHPHHNPEHIALPIGPVYMALGGFPYRREFLAPSPDSEEIRQMLLRCVAGIKETPAPEYPTSPSFDETVILQIGEFKEVRAAEELRRIVRVNPFSAAEDGPFGNDRVRTVALAVKALAAVVGDQAYDVLLTAIKAGRREADVASPYDPTEDRLAFIRYKTLEATRHCAVAIREEIARSAKGDPNDEVAALARELLGDLI